MTAVTTSLSPPGLLTYQDYMAEGEINLRYDILDGERVFIPGVTDEHQDCQGNLFVLLRDFERQFQLGKARMAPRDVLITRTPLRTRQPDVYFISATRNAQNPAPNDPAPMTASPELVVEIISDSETEKRFAAKMADYCEVSVQECWKVRLDTHTVEVLRVAPTGFESVGAYSMGETVQSLAFPDLTADVAAIFAS